MAVDERNATSVVAAECPCYLKTTKGHSYLAKFEVNRSELNHAAVTWELTSQRDKALVFCSEDGAGLIAVLFERYVRSSKSSDARFFYVLPLDISCAGAV